MTRQQLNQRVGQCALALRDAGVVQGDRIVAYVPNCIDAVIYMLATASVGALWSSASPDFGVTGVLDRFTQIAPKILISVNAVIYNGKVHNHLEKLELVAAGLPSVIKVIVIPFVHPIQPNEMGSMDKWVTSTQFLEPFSLSKPIFAQVPFHHPLVIVFSSGTTGILLLIKASQNVLFILMGELPFNT